MLSRVLMSLVGLWPYLNSRAQLIRRIAVLFILTSLIFFQVAKFFTSVCTLHLLSRVSPFIILSIGAMIKFILHWVKEDSIKELLDCIRYDWNNFESEEEIAIMKHSLKPGLYFNRYWALSVYATLCIYFLTSMSPQIFDYFIPLNESRVRQQPLILECFIDQNKYYYPILLYSWVSFLTTVTIIVATKLTYIGNILHTTGILGIAGYKFKHVFDKTTYFNSNDIYEIRRRLYSGVTCHKRAIRLTTRINDCYGLADFCNSILLPVPSISLCLYCSRILVGEWTEIIVLDSVAFTLIVSLFLYLYPGQILLNASSVVFQNVYFSLWYTASPDAQKLLLLVLCRTSHPNAIVMGNIVTASMDTFARVLQSCLSYFTLLCSLR